MDRGMRPNWLKHISGDHSDPGHLDDNNDLLKLKLEQEVAAYALMLRRSFGIPKKRAEEYAASTLVDEALAVQREVAPGLYVRMLTILASSDGALQPMREQLLQRVRHYGRRRFLQGAMCGLLIWAAALAMQAILAKRGFHGFGLANPSILSIQH
jgi:hypothetical protein